jgi:asparagine synthase (glutamine-hydrolysing)
MCGLTGYVANKNVPIDIACLDRSLSALAHRGPDAKGRLDLSWASLRHARLSIIDVSSSGDQPIFDQTGRFAIVFNGEIYNYQELARRFLSDATEVNTNSDTVVFVELFARYGRECLDLLDGMFAAAILDTHSRSVFLARDRFGEKPLYWAVTKGGLAFASETRALRKISPGQLDEIDDLSQAIFHMAGSVPAPRTIFRDIRSLEPGWWLHFVDGRVTHGRYWSLPAVNRAEHSQQSAKGAVAEVTASFNSAVSSRMVSDVPVGLFLSGGIDSGSILSGISTLGIQGINAICLDFEEKAFSEFALAKLCSDTFGAQLHRRVIGPEEFLASLPTFFESMDQPTGDGFNTYFVCQAAKELHIKVWLSGVGGDEVFGGYPSFRRLNKVEVLAGAMRAVPSLFADLVAETVPDRLKLNRLANLVDAGGGTTHAYQTLRNFFSWRVARWVLEPSWNPKWEMPADVDVHYPRPIPLADDFQRASQMELSCYMRSQLLRDMDNFSMAHSLEVRAPFLSRDLVEQVFPMQKALKTLGAGPKPLLTAALSKPLPALIRNHPKRGFTFPIESWLRKHMQETFRDVAFDPSTRTFWNPKAIATLWTGYLAGRVHWSVLWQLYAYARWRQIACTQ